MAKIYMVQVGDYSDARPLAAFSSKERAREWAGDFYRNGDHGAFYDKDTACIVEIEYDPESVFSSLADAGIQYEYL